MEKGGFVNTGLCEGIEGVLAQKEVEDGQRLAQKVETEEQIRISRQEQVDLLREVRAFEGNRVYYRARSGAEEQRLDCKCVGKTFLRVSKNGGEPYKIPRSPGETIRTKVGRDLDILDDKIVDCARNLQKGLSRAEKRADEIKVQAKKDFDLGMRQLENVKRFRGRTHDDACRAGLIPQSRRRRYA